MAKVWLHQKRAQGWGTGLMKGSVDQESSLGREGEGKEEEGGKEGVGFRVGPNRGFPY